MNSKQETTLKIQQIKVFEASIKQSKVNLNRLLTLLKFCEDTDDLVKFHAARALSRLFASFMESGDLSHWKNIENKKKIKRQKKETTDESSPLLQVRKWIRKRYLKYLTILFNFLRTSSPGLQVTALNILMTLIRVISETRAREEKKPLTFQNVLLLELLAAATHNENLTEHFVKEFKDNYLHRFDDIRYYTLYNLEKLIEDQRSKLRQNGNVSSSLSQETETFVWNVYHILNALNMPRKNNDLKHFFIPLPSNASSEKKKQMKSPKIQLTTLQKKSPLWTPRGLNTNMRKVASPHEKEKGKSAKQKQHTRKIN